MAQDQQQAMSPVSRHSAFQSPSCAQIRYLAAALSMPYQAWEPIRLSSLLHLHFCMTLKPLMHVLEDSLSLSFIPCLHGCCFL